MTDAIGFDIEMESRDQEASSILMPSELVGASKHDPCIGCFLNKEGYCPPAKTWCFRAKMKGCPKTDEGLPKEEPKRHHGGRKPRRVIRLTDGKIYPSAKEAAEECGVMPPAIHSCCKGNTIATKGHQYDYEGSDRGIIKKRIMPNREYTKRRVRHIPTQEVYASAAEAGQANDHAVQTVYLHLCGHVIDKKYEYVTEGE